MTVLTGMDLPENSRISNWQFSGVISCNKYSTSKTLIVKKYQITRIRQITNYKQNSVLILLTRNERPLLVYTKKRLNVIGLPLFLQTDPSIPFLYSFQAKRARMISDSEDENSSQGTSTSSALGVVDTSSSGEPSPHILEARLDMLEKAFPKIVSIFCGLILPLLCLS